MHEVPDGPFQKIGTDLFHHEGQDYLMIADYFSKFWEILRLPNTISATVIRKAKTVIARYGIPTEVISDNGPQFSSEEYRDFSEKWNFKHITSSPLYPESNGFAERNIQTAKKLLKKCEKDGSDPYLAMLEYRNTPIHPDMGSPAQLLQSRRLRSILPVSNDLLKPEIQIDVKRKLRKHQERVRNQYDQHKRSSHKLKKGDQIRFQKTKNECFKRGEIIEELEQPRSYTVRDQDGNQYRRTRSYFSRKPIEVEPQEQEGKIPTTNQETKEQDKKDDTSTSNIQKKQTDIQNKQTDKKNKQTDIQNRQTDNTNMQKDKQNTPVKVTSRGRQIIKPVRYR